MDEYDALFALLVEGNKFRELLRSMDSITFSRIVMIILDVYRERFDSGELKVS